MSGYVWVVKLKKKILSLTMLMSMGFTHSVRLIAMSIREPALGTKDRAPSQMLMTMLITLIVKMKLISIYLEKKPKGKTAFKLGITFTDKC